MKNRLTPVTVSQPGPGGRSESGRSDVSLVTRAQKTQLPGRQRDDVHGLAG